MGQHRDHQFQDFVQGFGKSSGLVLPFLLLVALPITFWSLRDPQSSPVQPAVVALFVVSAFWAVAAMLEVNRRCEILGWRRSHLSSLIAGSRPDDPEELLVWQWTLQSCCAFLMCAFCAATLYLMP
jgi:hypothetical protein